MTTHFKKPPPPVPNPTAEALRALQQQRGFFPSHGFMISAGTVTVDVDAKLILLIFNRRHGIYQLPKGRKDIGEDLLDCAMRETREETGLQVRPLPLRVNTRSTLPREQEVNLEYGSVEDGGGRDTDGERMRIVDGLTTGKFNCEPAACCHYEDLPSGALKMIYYFAAAVSAATQPAPLEGADVGRFVNVWCTFDEAIARLAFGEDRQVVHKVVKDLKQTGYEM